MSVVRHNRYSEIICVTILGEKMLIILHFLTSAYSRIISCKFDGDTACQLELDGGCQRGKHQSTKAGFRKAFIRITLSGMHPRLHHNAMMHGQYSDHGA